MRTVVVITRLAFFVGVTAVTVGLALLAQLLTPAR